MRPELRRILQHNRDRLIQELDITVGFLAELVSTGIIHEEHEEDIRCQSSLGKQVDRLLDILGRRPDAVFDQFIESVLKRQHELAECFKYTIYTPEQQVKSRSGDNVATQKLIEKQDVVEQSVSKDILDQNRYNDVLKEQLMKIRPIFESSIDPKGFIAYHLFSKNVITNEEFHQINNAKDRSERIVFLLEVLFKNCHPSPFIHLRSALENDYLWIVRMLDQDEIIEPNPHYEYDIYEKMQDYNKKAGKNIVQSCIIHKNLSKKRDDPTNLVETVTVQITQSCSDEEFLKHKEALDGLFCNRTYALEFKHLQTNPLCAFTILEIFPGDMFCF